MKINLLKLMHGCCAPDAGTLVNTTQNYVNAYDGSTTAFAAPNDLSSLMKTYYDTELLENARPNLIHAQFARKQPLPKGRRKLKNRQNRKSRRKKPAASARSCLSLLPYLRSAESVTM